MDKYALLGASRGLGWATYQLLAQKKSTDEFAFFLSSRQVEKKRADIYADTILVPQDFSKTVNVEFVEKLQRFAPTCLIYFAGGGPYGFFGRKKWADHMWSLQTSFLYPAELVHLILAAPEKWSHLKRIVLVGSSIAEDKPDPKAASYAAAKHALRGLAQTLQAELAEQKSDIQVLLFSPGYMQTDLLPVHSQPRLSDRAERPEIVAEQLIEYIEKN